MNFTGTNLYIVAHPDDELLFQNPDLETDIRSGNPVRTVYVTSGDGGPPPPPVPQWPGREQRVMAAHAEMAGVTDNWSCGGANYAGKATTLCVLQGRPQVSSLFLRLLDGGTVALMSGQTVGTVSLGTSTVTYTRAEMVATLTAIRNEVQPVKVGTLDGSRAYGFDHSDHINTAILGFDVARADGVARELAMYRGYSIHEPSFVTNPPIPAPEAENLTQAEYQEKLRIITVYESPPEADFDPWCRRFYPIRNTTGGPAPLHASDGRCLEVSGSTVRVAACNGGSSQLWTATAGSDVISSGGLCLAVGGDGSSIVVEACANSTDQRWTLMDNRQLRGAADTCLAFSGTNVASDTCGADMSQAQYRPLSAQRWNF